MSQRGGKREGAGRKPKPKLPLTASKGIATDVLGTLGTKYQIQQKAGVLPTEKDVWLSLLADKDRRLAFDALKYLTDRRDGKPAQGVFIGDTRENAPELDFGDLLMPDAEAKPRKAGKPH